MNLKDLWQYFRFRSSKLITSHQLDSTVNPAHLPQKWAIWAKLAVLFSW